MVHILLYNNDYKVKSFILIYTLKINLNYTHAPIYFSVNKRE